MKQIIKPPKDIKIKKNKFFILKRQIDSIRKIGPIFWKVKMKNTPKNPIPIIVLGTQK